MRYILLKFCNFLKIISQLLEVISTHLYFKYCIESCPACNGSGLQLKFNNDITDCSECKGDGYNEVSW